MKNGLWMYELDPNDSETSPMESYFQHGAEPLVSITVKHA